MLTTQFFTISKLIETSVFELKINYQYEIFVQRNIDVYLILLLNNTNRLNRTFVDLQKKNHRATMLV